MFVVMLKKRREKMKVCDRCKKELDTDKKSNLAGTSIELCKNCAGYILNHIKNYKEKQGGLGSLFK